MSRHSCVRYLHHHVAGCVRAGGKQAEHLSAGPESLSTPHTLHSCVDHVCHQISLLSQVPQQNPPLLHLLADSQYSNRLWQREQASPSGHVPPCRGLCKARADGCAAARHRFHHHAFPNRPSRNAQIQALSSAQLFAFLNPRGAAKKGAHSSQTTHVLCVLAGNGQVVVHTRVPALCLLPAEEVHKHTS
jgi:hypothetical protein